MVTPTEWVQLLPICTSVIEQNLATGKQGATRPENQTGNSLETSVKWQRQNGTKYIGKKIASPATSTEWHENYRK